ncbi:MAG: D-amino-acid transaminase [Pseudomonadota bacterium]
MTRVIYINGQYRPYDHAFVHAEDRGFQFGDAVYEVIEVAAGKLVDEPRHMARLARSLRELHMSSGPTPAAWALILRETVRRNRVRDGIVYLQVSRGAAPRDFLFPEPGTPLTVVCLARAIDPARGWAAAEKGIRIITRPDPRWARCDIKTVMLLPASLAKEDAKAAGAQEVWFVDQDGYVTEGGSSNAWILTDSGHLVTTPATKAILRGVTRMTVLDCCKQLGVSFEERRFTIDEAKTAREAFITSASNLVMPVSAIDDVPIGNGNGGTVARDIRANFHSLAALT